jgi:hypothetical protein
MDDKSLDTLTDVGVEVVQVAGALRDFVRKQDISKDQAIALGDMATRLGALLARLHSVTGWNGRDFTGSGDRVCASYDAVGLHDLTKRIVDEVGCAPVSDIAQVAPRIIEIVFPELVSKS